MTEKIISVSGCANCPFKQENDMGSGFTCRLFYFLEPERALMFPKYIEADKKFQPITPPWCPLMFKTIKINIEK